MNNTDNKSEDIRIIDSVLKGDERKFSLLLNKYETAIFFRIKRYVKDEEVGRDLVQEVFEKVYVKLHTYNSTYAFSTWLYTIAERHTIDYLRKKKLQTVSIDKPLDGKDGEMEIQIPDANYVPADSRIIRKEISAKVDEAMNQLPEKYRAVLELRHFEEYTYEEISEELNLPIGTVKAHIYRGREQLAKLLKDLKSAY